MLNDLRDGRIGKTWTALALGGLMACSSADTEETASTTPDTTESPDETMESATDPTPAADTGRLRVRRVRFNQADLFELRNDTTAEIDLSDFWLCANRSYRELSELSVDAGTLQLAAGASVTLSGFDFAEASDLGIYASQSFSSADALRAYVKWGQSGSADRESVGVAAGLWTDGGFVDVDGLALGGSIERTSEASTPAAWAVVAP